MARGDKNLYQQQQQAAYAQAQNLAQQSAKNQQNLLGTVAPMYEQEYQNPGYTPSEQQAIRQAASGALAGAMGAARARLLGQAARTGNAAGIIPAEEELARQQGQLNSQDLGALEQGFGNARMAGQQAAMSGLRGLYADTSQPLGIGMGAESNLVGDQARLAAQPSFWSQVAGRTLGGLTGLLNLGRGNGSGR
ncbi:MAG: hypothetical protein ACRD2H_06405 [Terriglobales bacterium]